MEEKNINWKELALWLLDCEAATSEIYSYSDRPSKSVLRRHQVILTEALFALEGRGLTPKARPQHEIEERLVRESKHLIEVLSN